MAQDQVLFVLYKQYKDTDGGFITATDVANICVEQYGIAQVSAKRSLNRLVYWSFAEKKMDKLQWKEIYRLTPRGLATARQLLGE